MQVWIALQIPVAALPMAQVFDSQLGMQIVTVVHASFQKSVLRGHDSTLEAQAVCEGFFSEE
jgi:hypothetical protein